MAAEADEPTTTTAPPADAAGTTTPSAADGEDAETTKAGDDATWDSDVFGDGTLLKRVIRAAPAGADGPPAKGHKCQVHYVGRVAETQTQFDSSRDRGQPFGFSIGQGVITGWSEAVPTMKVGEVALFRICAAKAYGAAGSPPTIPPDAALDFEIELLSFTDREDVKGDGSVLKKVLDEGDAWQRPNKRCDVELAVKSAWMAGGDDGWRDVAWSSDSSRDELKLDDGVTLPAALRTGVETMKKGERASILVAAPPEADGSASAKAAVDYEVRLKSWVENEDCVPERPGAVVKRTASKSDDESNWRTPNETDTVRVQGSLYVAGDPSRVLADFGAITDTSSSGDERQEPSGATWMIDEAPEGVEVVDAGSTNPEAKRKVPICDGLEAGLKRMKVDEVAVLKISPEYGFRDAAALGCSGGALEARVKLCHIEARKETWDMSAEEKIAAVGSTRAMGNAHFARKDYARAIRRYDAAIMLSTSEYDISDEGDKSKLKAEASTTRLNRAAAHLKLGDATKARTDANDVLSEDPDNAKALFRRAKANSALDEWPLARADLKKLLAADPANVDAKRALADVAKREKAHKDKVKQLYAGRKLFGRDDDPRVAASVARAKEQQLRHAEEAAEAAGFPVLPPEAPAPDQPAATTEATADTTGEDAASAADQPPEPPPVEPTPAE